MAPARSLDIRAGVLIPVMPMHRIIASTLAALVIGCAEQEQVQSKLSESIWAQLKGNDYQFIDFGLLAGKEWSRVCFFGPYNEQSSEALGFNWQVGDHTNVLRSDGHNVIVFATETDVLEYTAHSRGYGDFWKLSGKCFPREQANFVKDPESGNWLNYLSRKA
ncbi:hypothetical protein [Alloalcanivorax xenomutans]|uniref:hypothetical protein n=1 Tax=Alloalcanivorax xenomutans TaxID=1094342 RepID=UPI0024E25779|nr:hypothetical protein [Alloalcanivorax xenomutans]